MLPVVVTRKARNLRTGRLETWAARSTDGRWAFDRIDGDPATPWIVSPVVDGRVLDVAGVTATSLSKARRLITSCPAELVRYAVERRAELLARLPDLAAECGLAIDAYRSWFPAAAVELGEAIARCNLARRHLLTQLAR